MKPIATVPVRFTLAALGLAALVPAAASAQAKATCAAGKTGKPSAITAREAWELASPRARAWQADAVPFDLTTTSLGPLDADGKSKDWDVKFSSQSAKAGLVQEKGGTGQNWYLNYQNAEGREVLSVVIDARTGNVKNVFHSGK